MFCDSSLFHFDGRFPLLSSFVRTSSVKSSVGTAASKMTMSRAGLFSTTEAQHTVLVPDTVVPRFIIRLMMSSNVNTLLSDVHFDEDRCRVQSKNVQQNLNMLHKCALSIIRIHKRETQSKLPLNGIMFGALMNPQALYRFWAKLDFREWRFLLFDTKVPNVLK